MPKVFIPPQMRGVTDGRESLTVAGANLRQVVAALEAECPGLAARLQDGDRLATGLAVSIDGEISGRGMLTIVRADSEIHFLPAIGGG